ncbi:MAG: DUF885 family protein [Planctomycetaceae bacterium]|nr:MAG: DUF885 family protein [Planctomycetaceae bacterium]
MPHDHPPCRSSCSPVRHHARRAAIRSGWHSRQSPAAWAAIWSLLAIVSLAVGPAAGEELRPATDSPPVEAIAEPSDVGLSGWITRYSEDRRSLELKYQEPLSPLRAERMGEFYRSYQLDLRRIDSGRLRGAAVVDHALMRNELEYRIALADLERIRDAQVLERIPAVLPLVELLQRHQRTHRIDAKATAELFVQAERDIAATLKTLASGRPADGVAATAAAAAPAAGSGASAEAAVSASGEEAATALRAAKAVRRLTTRLESLHRFYQGYDPLYSWWCRVPYESLAESCRGLASGLGRLGGDDGDEDKILGIPIGQRAMEIELAHEMIPYTPAELIEIAEREFRWCDQQMLAASRELGFGDDWRAALESVKERHVPPGDQPAMIARLAEEATRFVRDRDLVTVPPLCEEVWRMEMMSPARQRVNPFFLGGDTIQVSYPTDSMTHEEKRMSMRGNNEHFARATVHHELIPGHHLQLFMTSRYRPDRREFRTPFWIEGWALYWEMLLWDKGFARSAEDRVGMLFWRMHRCARIVFSLGFQLGRMSPEECVEYLVSRVGHERANAEAEVRRSLIGDYPPLYQAAYMLGGLQIRALRAEWVDSGKLGERDFHDAILRQGPIPIALVRLALAGDSLDPDEVGSWRFADSP